VRSVKHRDDLLTTYTYGDASRLRTTQLPNNVTSAYDFEASEHALEIRYESPDELFSSLEHTSDSVYNRT
jgi:hypothetical protein